MIDESLSGQFNNKELFKCMSLPETFANETYFRYYQNWFFSEKLKDLSDTDFGIITSALNDNALRPGRSRYCLCSLCGDALLKKRIYELYDIITEKGIDAKLYFY